MARAIADIEKNIRALSADEKPELLRLVDGSVKGVPGHLVFERLRSRLAEGTTTSATQEFLELFGAVSIDLLVRTLPVRGASRKDLARSLT